MGEQPARSVVAGTLTRARQKPIFTHCFSDLADTMICGGVWEQSSCTLHGGNWVGGTQLWENSLRSLEKFVKSLKQLSGGAPGATGVVRFFCGACWQENCDSNCHRVMELTGQS